MSAADEEVLFFWLSGIPGIGAVRANRLIRAAGSLRKLYAADMQWVRETHILKEKECMAFGNSRNWDRIISEWNAMRQQGIFYLSQKSEEYPVALQSIAMPPFQLYRMGKPLRSQKLSIGVIGARDCTCYGRDMARMFAFRLAKQGVCIVSGMARGIDGWAHQGALEAGGETIAVLGSGVDVCYPALHRRLYESICRQGTVVSELYPGTKARPQFFPLRNRIISGMSDGILLIEAGKKSGSLITVEAALEQGKDVFVIPGRIGDTLSEGCNRLILQGAVPVLTPQDILSFYQYEECEENTIYNRRNSSDAVEYTDPLEEKILRVLEPGTMHADALCHALGCSATEGMKVLNRLRSQGKIREISRGFFACV